MNKQAIIIAIGVSIGTWLATAVLWMLEGPIEPNPSISVGTTLGAFLVAILTKGKFRG